MRVWLQRGLGPKEMRELRAGPRTAQAAHVPGHDLRLLSLEPYPITGKPIAKSDYVATLIFSRAATADPER